MHDEVLEKLSGIFLAGDSQSAFALALKAEAVFPSSPSLKNLLGVVAATLGEKDKAVGYFSEALRLGAKLPQVAGNLGNVLRELGHLERAYEAYRQALDITPDDPSLLSGYANVLSGLERQEEALDTYRKAIRISPDYADAHSNLGSLLSKIGRLDEAVDALEQAIAINPNHADAHNNLGNVLAAMSRRDDAVRHFVEAARLKPDLVAAHNNLGNLFFAEGRGDEAFACFCKALEVDAEAPEANANLGNYYGTVGDPERACVHYDRVLLRQPDNLAVLPSKLHQQAMACNWDDVRVGQMEILRTSAFDATAIKCPPPFAVLTLFDDPSLQLRASASYAQFKAGGVRPKDFASSSADDGRIRVGYFSADFRTHPTMHLMARFFEVHDRGRFETHAFYFGPPVHGDLMQERLKTQVDFFHDVRTKPDEEIAQLSRDFHLDIAVDMTGYCGHSRPAIFAHRAAPVQVNYLGYPGTCGSAIWDYIIADERIAPEGSEADYAEKLVLLPDSYQVNDDTKVISQRTFSRSECGLPETGFVFCCFNNSYKITPAEFDIWMRLLKAVEGSVLWLLKGTREAEQNLRREAATRGVGAGRLVFAERLPVPDHLARHAHADLFLDTFVVNAHTTASDALWAGLPVLVKAGRSFVSRVSASLVHAAGLPELITENEADYEALALSLALDPARLGRMKKHLKDAPSSLPLFDTARYTRNLERAFDEMVRISRAGERPRKISLD